MPSRARVNGTPGATTLRETSGVEIVGLGVDICEIARMERALARHPTLRTRVFTPEEIAYCDGESPAGRVLRGQVRGAGGDIKALGGYRASGWQDISVARHPSGAPRSCWRATRSAGPTPWACPGADHVHA